ncbi:gliding motility-associated C-terminal domain-containing protein [Jejudonia soesokkakensis]|uniref:Gliding motility-associated C-terminal domain-containing protein n=1 Tax=Jejudonia soesokkakensis TaxID=1323432 RepID=A0ABW2MU24_9FLAO
MPRIHTCIGLLLFLYANLCVAQDVELFRQLNGRYDYLSFGNTLNPEENGGQGGNCEILSQSSAAFTLENNQQVIAAYLYWSGSGTGDFEVALNGTPITSEREFAFSYTANNGVSYDFFAAQADITSFLASNGNGTYTLSELDLLEAIQPFCQSNGGSATNYGGWAVTVVYEDETLPLNQINIFEGLETVFSSNPAIAITLENLNVLDNAGAKIGFLAWEGDATIANNETLRINGSILSNDPLNPANNAFNGTNSFTNSNELYNMDIDFYSIENNIQPGDTSAVIELTSNQDLVMINQIITVLNVELPDATITIDTAQGGTECGNRDILLDYTVLNINSTDVLPANIPIAFYANNTLVGQAITTQELAINEQESGSINVSIPPAIPADFTLTAAVDDDGNGNSTVLELNELNNETRVDFHLLVFPEVIGLQNLEVCDAVGTEFFNLTEATLQIDPVNILSYYTSESDAQNGMNPITTPEAFENTQNPQTLFIRVSNPDCFVIDSFTVEVIICPLPDATIEITNNLNACRERDLTVNYIVFNSLGTLALPAGTPIAFYVNGTLVAQSQTQSEIAIGASENGSIEITLAPTVPDNFTLLVVVDDTGFGMGIVEELNEFNNTFQVSEAFMSIPPIGMIPLLTECDEGFDTATFDLTEQDDEIATSAGDTITYFLSEEDANTNSNPILDPGQFTNTSDPQTIYVRLENEICFDTSAFQITTENCPPFIPEGFSPNNDTINDEFEISGLLNVFTDFNLKIYSRKGNLLYEGGNEEGFWNGVPNTGLLHGEGLVPVGTYYYVLVLNDPQFTEAYVGFVYINY